MNIITIVPRSVIVLASLMVLCMESHGHRTTRVMYNGHKWLHSIKFQSVLIPKSLIANLHCPFEGKWHDSAMLQETGVLCDLPRIAFYNGDPLCLYGDPAYQLGVHLQAPFRNMHFTLQMGLYNHAMSEV